jgi:predicted metal-dependent peptidase
MHHWERAKHLDRTRWNLATDYDINEQLNDAFINGAFFSQ